MRLLGAIGAALAVLSLPVSAQAENPGTITDIVAASGGEFDDNKGDFDILLNAVLAAELDGVLADTEADFTVFAPSDAAFIELAHNLGNRHPGEAAAFNTIVAALTELGDGDPIPLLRSILLYHVSPEGKTTAEIKASPIVTTAFDGQTVISALGRLLDNEPDLKDPRLQKGATNIVASNGIIHVITRVLIPLDIDNTDNDSLPTIAGAVAASGGVFDDNRRDFDILLNAVIAADLVGALDMPGDSLTVFAPDDAAFMRTARALGYKGHTEEGAFAFIVAALTELGDGDPIPLLTAVLLYHVAPGDLPVKTVLEFEAVDTLLTDATFAVNVNKRRLIVYDPYIKNPRIYVNRGSIRASNGFINTISYVLIPVDLSTL